MKRNLILITLLVFLGSKGFCQYRIAFKLKKDDSMERVVDVNSYNILKIKTKDTIIYPKQLISCEDNVLTYSTYKDTLFIPASRIKSIKISNNYVQSLGYTILVLSALGFAIGVPASFIEGGFSTGGEQALGTLGVASLSLPFIVIGSNSAIIRMRMWKIDRVQNIKIERRS